MSDDFLTKFQNARYVLVVEHADGNVSTVDFYTTRAVADGCRAACADNLAALSKTKCSLEEDERGLVVWEETPAGRSFLSAYKVIELTPEQIAELHSDRDPKSGVSWERRV